MDLFKNNPSFLIERVKKMAETRLKRRTINSEKDKREMRYFDLILVGIASQIIVLVGSLNAVSMNGVLCILILMVGDTCLACGVDYYKSKNSQKKKRKK